MGRCPEFGAFDFPVSLSMGARLHSDYSAGVDNQPRFL